MYLPFLSTIYIRKEHFHAFATYVNIFSLIQELIKRVDVRKEKVQNSAFN